MEVNVALVDRRALEHFKRALLTGLLITVVGVGVALYWNEGQQSELDGTLGALVRYQRESAQRFRSLCALRDRQVQLNEAYLTDLAAMDSVHYDVVGWTEFNRQKIARVRRYAADLGRTRENCDVYLEQAALAPSMYDHAIAEARALR